MSETFSNDNTRLKYAASASASATVSDTASTLVTEVEAGRSAARFAWRRCNAVRSAVGRDVCARVAGAVNTTISNASIERLNLIIAFLINRDAQAGDRRRARRWP